MATREIAKLITRARRGESTARLELGRLYLSGTKGIAPNSTAALTWLVEAWNSGCHEAAHEIARIEPITVLPETLLESYMAACDHAASAGCASASFALAEAYAGLGLVERAASFYRRAAEQGHARAAFRLGCLALESRVGGETVESARNWLEEAAERGEHEAVARLAALLEQVQDSAAIPWLRRLAQHGDVAAMVSLARMLLLRPNPEAAREIRTLLIKASKHEDPTALWLWGRLQARQLRGPELEDLGRHSWNRALDLLQRAAALGIAAAHWDLARLYALPETQHTDQRAARRHLEAAAKAGIPEAQVRLAQRLVSRRDLEAWLTAGDLLSAAREHPDHRESAERLLAEIADSAPDWPAEILAEQGHVLKAIEGRYPRVAARLRLAAAFRLNKREALFIDLQCASRGWCLVADLTTHFQYGPWRIVMIETGRQREALNVALVAAQPTFPGEDELLTGATTRSRSRQLAKILGQEFSADPGIFIVDWHATPRTHGRA